MTTAYEQLMASLDERVKAQEADLKAAFARIQHAEQRVSMRVDELEVRANTYETGIIARLDAALRRIEQLEREGAVLKGPRQSERARIAEFYLTRDQINHAQQLVPAEGLTQGPLPCGCRGPYCGGHQFNPEPAYSQAVSQKIESIAKSMELVSTCLDLGIDANDPIRGPIHPDAASERGLKPLPDEGT